MINIDTKEEGVKPGVGEEANLDTTPVAKQEGTEEVEPTTGIPEGGETETEESKKGAGPRIRELNQRAKTAEEKAQSLEQKLAELTGSVNPTPELNPKGSTQPQFNPQEPIVAPGEEIDVNELNRRISEREQRILQTANASAQLMQKQSEAINRINSEASKVVEKYPQLNPESDSFDRELSDTVTEAVEAYVKSSPYDASVEKFTSRLMNSLAGAAAKEAGQATENIAKQVSSAALRPTSVREPEKKASDKSIAELEKELGVINS